MSYKTIIVCLSDKEEAERLLPVAVMVARKFDAHLIGVHSLQRVDIYGSLSIQLSGNAMAEMQDIQEEHAGEIKQIFEQLTRVEEFVSEWRQITSSTTSAGERLAEQTRCADLVIMSQIDPDQSHPGPADIQRHVIEHGGRPVLVVPRYGEFEHIGNRTLIGWSGTGQCSRAVHDAIPFCKHGTKTHIFWVNGNDKSADARLESSGLEIAGALSRHGINATAAHRTKSEIPIGDELLNEASDAGADLIVTGAYGHSKLYDFVIGATTSHLLKYMTSPVLFSR